MPLQLQYVLLLPALAWFAEPALLRQFLLLTYAACFVNNSLKQLLRLPRPPVELHLNAGRAGHEELAAQFGFPSTHCACACALSWLCIAAAPGARTRTRSWDLSPLHPPAEKRPGFESWAGQKALVLRCWRRRFTSGTLLSRGFTSECTRRWTWLAGWRCGAAPPPPWPLCGTAALRRCDHAHEQLHQQLP